MKKIKNGDLARNLGFVTLLLGGSLVGCNNNTYTVGVVPPPIHIIPLPHPTICPAMEYGDCGGPPIRVYPPIIVSTGSSGGVISSSGSTGGSLGSTGSAGGSSGSTGGSTGVSAGGSSGSVSSSASVDGDIKDVDLQRADAQEQDLNARATSVAAQFQMSLTSAVQLTELSDQITEMTNSGQQMTDEDRAAVTNAALEIAGITNDDITTATAQSLSGNASAVNDLLTKAALNMGMSSVTVLRDQLLPAVGVNLN
jgi:hypothetical protein